jgi:ABC-type nitrate/sulfonate/bicarbonate transport system substrate-binding protein
MSGAVFAASKGIKLKLVVKEARESLKDFSTSAVALADSGITPKTLKGKSIAINGYRTSIELYSRVAALKAGLNPDRDVKWIVMPFSQMADALKAHKVDIAILPTQFAYFAKREGGFKTVYTSASISGVEEEQDVYFSPDFVAKHPDAVRAWAQDFAAVTRYLLSHQKEARQSLLDAKFVNIEPAIYLAMTAKDDLERTADIKPSLDTLRKVQDMLLKVGFIEHGIDVTQMIDTRFAP